MSEDKNLTEYRIDTLSMLFKNFWEETIEEAYDKGRNDYDDYQNIHGDMNEWYCMDIETLLSKDLKFSIFEFNKKQILDLMNMLMPSMNKELLQMKLLLTNYLFKKLDLYLFNYVTPNDLKEFFEKYGYDKSFSTVIEYSRPCSGDTDIYQAQHGTEVDVIIGCTTDVLMNQDELNKFVKEVLAKMELSSSDGGYRKIGANPDKYKTEIKKKLIEEFPKDKFNPEVMLEDVLDVNIAMYHTFLAWGQTFRSFEESFTEKKVKDIIEDEKREESFMNSITVEGTVNIDM